jgi:hypothetical protein
LRGKELWVLVSGWGREDEQEKMARRGEDGRGRGGLSPAGLGQKNPSRGGGDCFGEDERKGRGRRSLERDGFRVRVFFF